MVFDEMEQALMKNQFRLMYADVGYEESLLILEEIIETASLLTEVLIEEKRRDIEEGTGA